LEKVNYKLLHFKTKKMIFLNLYKKFKSMDLTFKKDFRPQEGFIDVMITDKNLPNSLTYGGNSNYIALVSFNKYNKWKPVLHWNIDIVNDSPQALRDLEKYIKNADALIQFALRNYL